MKMKMTNAAMIEVAELLNKFPKANKKLGYAISKTKRKIMAELEDFYNFRNDLIMQYGEKNDDNEGYKIDQNSDNFQEFMKEIIPILQETSEIDVYTISEEDFYDSDYYNENAEENDYEVLASIFIAPKEDKDESAE